MQVDSICWNENTLRQFKAALNKTQNGKKFTANVRSWGINKSSADYVTRMLITRSNTTEIGDNIVKERTRNVNVPWTGIRMLFMRI